MGLRIAPPPPREGMFCRRGRSKEAHRETTRVLLTALPVQLFEPLRAAFPFTNLSSSVSPVKMMCFSIIPRHASAVINKKKRESQRERGRDSKHLTEATLEGRWAVIPPDDASPGAFTRPPPFFFVNKRLWMRSHSSDLGALLPCNHVLLCMATFVISRWQRSVRRKQFYLMDGHKRGERLYQLRASPVNYAQQQQQQKNPANARTGCLTTPASSNILRRLLPRTPRLVRMCARPIHYHSIYVSP